MTLILELTNMEFKIIMIEMSRFLMKKQIAYKTDDSAGRKVETLRKILKEILEIKNTVTN